MHVCGSIFLVKSKEDLYKASKNWWKGRKKLSTNWRFDPNACNQIDSVKDKAPGDLNVKPGEWTKSATPCKYAWVVK